MPSSWQRKDDEEEEEEDEIDENAYIAQKDAVLFAIEVSESMIRQPLQRINCKNDTDSPAIAALKCAYKIMQDRIISNPKDMMGILLFGTEKSKFQDESEGNRGGLAFPNCYLLADLDIPDADTVKLIKRLVDDANVDEANDLLKPSAKPVAMSNLLFCANQAFTTKAPNFGSRRLFIITDNDDPHADDKDLRRTAAVRAKDLYDLGVVIELFPISKAEHEFKREAFYDDILYADPNPDALSVSPDAAKPMNARDDGVTLLTSLISNVKSKQIPKRALFSKMPFEIGPGLKISVKGYNILQKQAPSRSTYIWENGEKFQIAQSKSTMVAENDMREIEKKDPFKTKAFKFGGTKIHFNDAEQNNELQRLKDFAEEHDEKGNPKNVQILRILGFKPEKWLPIWSGVKKSTFIYPSEDDFVGSTRVFAALHQKLLKDKLIGLAWFVARSNAAPMIVAILPSTEVFSKSGAQISPAGLWLYPIPFADDIRPLPAGISHVVADGSLIDEMLKTIRQLQLPNGRYDPTLYPNPTLQWHYRILQAMALEEVDTPQAPVDKCLPKYRQIKKRAASHLGEWNALLDQQAADYDGTHRESSVKRKRGSTEDDASLKKKIKTEQTEITYSKDDMKAIWKSGKLKGLTVKTLKDFLKSEKLVDTGLKADLIERVEEIFE